MNDETNEMMNELKELNRLYGEGGGMLEVWQQLIEKYTFKTVTFNITRKEAVSLERMNTYCWGNSFREQPKYNEYEEDNEIIKDVEIKMKNAMKEMPCDGYFVRLGTRSAKDALSKEMEEKFNKEIERMYMEEMGELKGKEKKGQWKERMNMKDVAVYYKARFGVMKCKTSEEMMDMLLNSERIRTDLRRLLGLSGLDDGKIEVIALREWCDEIKPTMEFRGFVYKDRLTALSQYNPLFYVKELIENKQEVEDTIREFFTNEFIITFQEKRKGVEDISRLTSYVVDFCVCNLKEKRIKIIELNSFSTFVGTSLFTWKDDMEVLFGKKPFEFRINTNEENSSADLELFSNDIKKLKLIKAQILEKDTSCVLV